MEAARARLAIRVGHARLVLCCLQAVQELQACDCRRLHCLGIGVGFGLHTKISSAIRHPACLCALAERPYASSAVAWCCGQRGGAAGGGRGLRLVEPPGVARSWSNFHPARATGPLLSSPRTAADDAKGSDAAFTYRYFLSLCRTTLALSCRSGSRFALRRALHFRYFRSRVTFSSQIRRISTFKTIVGVVQWCCACVPRRGRASVDQSREAVAKIFCYAVSGQAFGSPKSSSPPDHLDQHHHAGLT